MSLIERSRNQIGYRLATVALRISTPQYRATLKALIVLGMDWQTSVNYGIEVDPSITGGRQRHEP